jgi:acyl-coenzyme A synthetase/AMP-(fatty) acid ligase
MCDPTDVVSIGGRQIVLAEIENILKEHAGVRGAMVTA